MFFFLPFLLVILKYKCIHTWIINEWSFHWILPLITDNDYFKPIFNILFNLVWHKKKSGEWESSKSSRPIYLLWNSVFKILIYNQLQMPTKPLEGRLQQHVYKCKKERLFYLILVIKEPNQRKILILFKVNFFQIYFSLLFFFNGIK